MSVSNRSTASLANMLSVSHCLGQMHGGTVPAWKFSQACDSCLRFREVGSHGPQPEWNDPEPTLPQRLAEKSPHLVQPAS